MLSSFAAPLVEREALEGHIWNLSYHGKMARSECLAMDLGTLLWMSRRLDQQLQAEKDANSEAMRKAKSRSK